MSDHERYEELTALIACGFLSEQENKELREHTKVCPECLRAEEELCGLFRSGLPPTENPIREFVQRLRMPSDDEIRERFLARARREGVVFSPDVQRTSVQRANRLATIVAATATLAAIVVLAVYLLCL
jgi:hypothetical protein